MGKRKPQKLLCGNIRRIIVVGGWENKDPLADCQKMCKKLLVIEVKLTILPLHRSWFDSRGSLVSTTLETLQPHVIR